MRILLINHTFDATDGQGKVNLRLAEHLLETGSEVTLVGRNVPRSLAERAGVRTHELGPSELAPTQMLRHLTFGWKTAAVIRRLRAQHDLVVANGGMTFAEVDVCLCHFVQAAWLKSLHHPVRSARAARPLWSRYQALYTRQGAWWEANAYRRARRVVAVSGLVRDQLIQRVGVDESKIRVVENGLEPSQSKSKSKPDERAGIRREFGVDDDRFVLLFVGELKTPRKNFEVLLEALLRLPEEVVLVAAGGSDDGPYPGRARAMGLSDRVRFMGFRRDVERLYSGADAFALLSHYEPFGLVVTEAMAAGLPVITAITVGASGVVMRYGAGAVIDRPDDAGAVIQAVNDLLHDPALRRERGANAQSASEELAWGRVGDRYLAVLQEVHEEKRSGQRRESDDR